MKVTNLDIVALNSFASTSKFNVEQIKEVIHLYEENIITQYIVAHNIILDLSNRWKTRQSQGIQKKIIIKGYMHYVRNLAMYQMLIQLLINFLSENLMIFIKD